MQSATNLSVVRPNVVAPFERLSTCHRHRNQSWQLTISSIRIFQSRKDILNQYLAEAQTILSNFPPKLFQIFLRFGCR